MASAAPELVSRDLRSHVLPLYFFRPLRRTDYPLAKYLAMTAALPAALGQMVDAALLVDARHRLVLRWSGHATRGAGGERVLAEGVAALVVGYRAAGAAGAWQPDWNGPGLPGLVRLSVVWTDHARRPWPPIIAGPTLTFPRG